jgi:hypothetical protein
MGVEGFISRWHGREGGAERANYVLFLRELTDGLGLPIPEPADTDSSYRFEYPVRGDHGPPLRIDLYKKGAFILEAKQSRLAENAFRRHDKGEAIVQADRFGDVGPTGPARARRGAWNADMRAAFNQAWDYASRLPADHERPPFIITCDVGRSFEFFADFTGQGRAYRAFPDERRRIIGLDQLTEPAVQDHFRKVWTTPAMLDPALRRAEATREVAGYLAEVSKRLEDRGEPPEEVATFLTRTLFAMFAEDVGLLPENAFKGLLGRCLESPNTAASHLSDLFEKMDTGGFSAGLGEMVRRFNGAFYKNRRAFRLEKEEIGALLAAARKDWRDVEPAIFGTLLEQALDPKDRGRLGAHYTPRPYVERLVQATVMDPLRQDWDAARAAAEDRRDRGDLDGAAVELTAFYDQLTQTRILDPACGTGNFLYVTMELMKALEAEVLEARASLAVGDADDLLSADALRGVDPRRFYGLELNPRAAAITELVLWIGYLQASYRRDPGYRPRSPVLEDYGTINPVESRRRPGDPCVDAVLQSDGPVIGGGGTIYPNARLPAWPEAEFIVGNPPFTGGKDLRAEQGDAYVEALWRAHPHMDGASDFVMYWWDRSADILTRKGSKLRRFGLVTTNSITQVFQRRTTARWLSADNPNKRPLSLVFAVANHPWTKATRNAAAVRIGMTVAQAGNGDGVLALVTREAGLDTDQPDIEFTIQFGRINPDLTVGVDLTKSKELVANAGICSPGVKLHGSGFIVRPIKAAELGLGRDNRPGLDQYIRPYRNGRDLVGRSREVMVIDLFDLEIDHVRGRFPEVYQHLSQTVRPARDRIAGASGTRDAAEYAAKWWLFGKPRQELRSALAGLHRYIATVETSKHRTFQFLDASIIPDNKLIVIASDDAALLALLQSTPHVSLSVRAGGWLGVGNDPVYVKSRCFDPFPFPSTSPVQHAALSDAGERLDAFRKARLAEHPGLTITRLYNALEAHRAGRAPGAGMTQDEAEDFARGSVLVLAELHDEIDRLTLEAYGWPADLSGEPLLAALVALNAERAAEEARGQVRWLRPLYQRPRLSRATVAGPGQAGDLLGQIAPPVAGATPWPKNPRGQVLAIKGALAEAPCATATLIAQFKGRTAAADIRRLLGVLQRDGQIRRAPDGTYSLLRAA